jgi:hypothetical protein
MRYAGTLICVDDIDTFLDKLNTYENIRYVHPIKKHS